MAKVIGLLLLILLAIFLFVSAWPVSPILVVVFFAYLFADAKSKTRVWAKATSATLMPLTIALCILSVCAMLFQWLDPGTGEALLNGEDRLALYLYHLFKRCSPPLWAYLCILAIATWISWKRAETEVV